MQNQKQRTLFDSIPESPRDDALIPPTATMIKDIDAISNDGIKNAMITSTEKIESKESKKDIPHTNSPIVDETTPADAKPVKERLSQTDKIRQNHVLIDGKTNEEAVQALIAHLDTTKDVQASANMTAITLPPGLFMSYTISGSTFGMKTETETEYIDKIKKALPSDLRGAPSRLRTVIDRQLDQLSIRVHNGLRYVPAQNFPEVQKLLHAAETDGVGKDNKHSVQQIINDMWEQRDIINANAIEYGIDLHIDNMESLKRRICLSTFYIDTSFGGENTLDPALIDQVVETKKQQVVDQLNNTLVNDMQDILSKIGKLLANATNTKTGKPNARSVNALQKEIDRIRSLNLTQNNELSTLLDAADGLIVRSIVEAEPVPSTTRRGRNKSNTANESLPTTKSKGPVEEVTEEPVKEVAKTIPENSSGTPEEVDEAKSLEELILRGY
jgi:hypothetical protein